MADVVGYIDDALCALEALKQIEVTITELNTVPKNLVSRIDLVIDDLQDWKNDYVKDQG